MGSRFLSGGAFDITTLQDGSTPINVASAVIQSLTPSLPVHTDVNKNLISGLINLADCNFSPIVNPMAVALDMGGNDITDIKELLVEANGAPTTPPINNLTIYESGDKLRYKDHTASVFQVATLTDLGSYLALAGGTMSGAIAMGTNNITNVGSISGAANSRTADNILSCSTAQTTGNLLSWSSSAKVVVDSGVIASSVVSGPGSSTAGDVAVYSNTTGNVISDTGVPLSSLATTASLANYLPLAGGTMSGAINMGGFDVNNVGNIFMATTNTVIGNGASATGSTAIVIGYAASGVNDTTVIGRNALADVGCNQSVVIGAAQVHGPNNTAVGWGATIPGGQQSIAIGYQSSAGGTGGGHDACIAIGPNCVNADVGTCMIGNVGIANIRPNGTGACDLGSTVNTFKSIYLGGSVIGPTNSRTADNILSCATNGVSGDIATFTGTAKVVQDSGVLLSSLATNAFVNSTFLPLAGGTMSGSINMGTNNITNAGSIDSGGTLSVGPTTATQVIIGRVGITSTVAGVLSATQGLASWYSTTTFNPSFAAGTNRLTPPTAATAGTLSQFTHSTGVLTYTGTPTRSFRISYNITFTSSGTNGTNMTFFNSINGSTTIGTQTQQKIQINGSNSNTQMCLVLTDIVTLSTGNTVQLGGACALLSAAVAYNFVSCNITRMLE